MGIELIGLSKSFGSKLKISNLSYKFPEKGVIAIIGESGVGKTTLAKIIAGLDTKYEGQVIGGGPANVSYVFQEYRLFPTLSALDNVIYANFDKKTEENIMEASTLLLKLGFEEYELSLKPSALSGGMKQRVSLARAILKKSDILILDEATKELDSELKSIVLNLIKDQAKERLVILITHDLSDINAIGAEVLELKSPD